jgi:hypothetical protein
MLRNWLWIGPLFPANVQANQPEVQLDWPEKWTVDWIGPRVRSDAMFAIECPRHGRRVLLDESRIEVQTNGPDGPVTHWRCWCGARGRLVRGRTPAATII